MRKLVIISSGAGKYIDLPDNTEYTILQPFNLVEELNKILRMSEEMTVEAIIFLQHSEYAEVFAFLGQYTIYEIHYKYVIFGTNEERTDLGEVVLRYISDFLTNRINPAEFDFIVRRTFTILDEHYKAIINRDDYLMKFISTRRDQEDLINIGRALSQEKDPDNLLRLILISSKRITSADAGTIYLVERGEDGINRLKFKYSHIFSRNILLEESLIDIDKKTIAGYVATTGEVLNIPDAGKLPDDVQYVYNNTMDEQNDYRWKSILVAPMHNFTGDIIGVIQLVNSKRDIDPRKQNNHEAFSIRLESARDFDSYVVPFNEKYGKLLEAIAGLAAIAIENNRLINQIQKQFEEFVRASVIAVESRDPGTSGHAFRVAEICKEIALAINDDQSECFKETQFSENAIRELELAALLHDFGKIYIDLSIFTKSKKLFQADFENLNLRLEYLYRYIELQYSLREVELLKMAMKTGGMLSDVAEAEREKNQKLAVIKGVKDTVMHLNEPAILNLELASAITEIQVKLKDLHCVDILGRKIEVISDNDKINLMINRGSLNPLERKEVESHVIHTYNFVSKIPWPPEYKNIPEIALRHHEKIDGSGYPFGVKGKESITIQARIMAIADIYDALMASDRPYKKAIPIEEVLDILREEAENNKIDKEIVDLFINKKIFEKVDKNSFSNA